MIVLQGLDYWIWAQQNQKWLRDRFNASHKAKIRILYAVAGKKGSPPSFSTYAKQLLAALKPEVDTEVRLIDSWLTGDIVARPLAR